MNPFSYSFSLFLFIFSVFLSSPVQADRKPVVPRLSKYIGVSLGGQMPLEDFNLQTGRSHGMNVEFFKFPQVVTTSWIRDDLDRFLVQSRAVNAVPLITIETFGGLSSYSVEHVKQLAVILNTFPQGVILRWNHEMNGPWYPWGQQPALYISKWREMATIMRQLAPNVALLWAPNQGDGYPWGGSLQGGVDPYAGYYPGDNYVDWVGLSIYHWGYSATAPEGSKMGNNAIPPLDDFSRKIRGLTSGITDFYQIYAANKNKPFVVSETSALYRSKLPGDSELAIKREWINQAYSLTSFPLLKAICWFNVDTYHAQYDDVIEWGLSGNQDLINTYKAKTSDPLWIKGTDRALFGNNVSTVLALGRSFSVPIHYVASGNRKIELVLYEVNDSLGGSSWAVKRRVTTQVTPGSGIVTLTGTAPTSMSAQARYLFEIRIMEPLADWTKRLHYDQLRVSFSTTLARDARKLKRKRSRRISSVQRRLE